MLPLSCPFCEIIPGSQGDNHYKYVEIFFAVSAAQLTTSRFKTNQTIQFSEDDLQLAASNLFYRNINNKSLRRIHRMLESNSNISVLRTAGLWLGKKIQSLNVYCNSFQMKLSGTVKLLSVKETATE